MANQVVYGFHHLQDRFSDTITTVGIDTVNDAITQAMDEHNRQLNAMLALFVRQGVEPQTAFRTATATRNQPLDEFGRPIPIKAPGRYTVGFPIQGSGNAIGYTWLHARKATVGELNDTINAIQIGDARWVFDHILGALFADTSYTFFDAENAGSLTVLPIANGDTQTYNVFSGGDVGATDDHTLAQANAIGAAADNPFPAIYAELNEHPENGNGPVIVLTSTSLKSSIQALATFNPVLPDEITLGSGSDRLTGTLGVSTPGTLLGMEDSGAWVVEYPRIPAGYMVAIKAGGEPPLGMREDPNVRGFVEADANEDFPWYQRNWVRMAGFGAWNRVGAVAYRVGNGTYAVPTNYTVPMP
jgi:hypothetical protein